MPDHKIVQCKTSFATRHKGRRVLVSAGDLYSADDELVKAHSHRFAEPKVRSSTPSAPVTSRAVETTSAGPGVRRTVTRPPGKTSKPEEAKTSKPEEGKATKPEEGKSDA
jgi:hypothetical protein